MAQSGTGIDYNEKPSIVVWEATQACALACAHCRAMGKPLRHPLELDTEEGKRLIDQVAKMKVPVFVITGGDPLKRPDLNQLIAYASYKGVRTSLAASGTPLLTAEAVAELKSRGVARLVLGLDGSTAEIHDGFRGVAGSYATTLQAVLWASDVRLPIQINTFITRQNFSDIEAIVSMLEGLDIVLWSVFFLVPTGPDQASDLITAEEFEEVFGKLYDTSCRVPFDITTTEAQHYRRFVLQARAPDWRRRALTSENALRPADLQPARIPGVQDAESEASASDGIGCVPRSMNDGNGLVFVSHLGEVYPSGFLPLSGGNVRRESLAEIYQRSPLFVSLRDASQLKGKCGICEFRDVCGGSRARAYALTGDPLAEEPCCVHITKAAAAAA